MSEQSVFDFIKSINKKGELKVEPDNKGNYNKYIVNKNFSLYPDSIFFSNEMNMYNTVTEEMHFDFYYHSLEARNRWTPWPKKMLNEDLTMVQKYYKVGSKDAACILENMDEAELKLLKKQYDFIKGNDHDS